MAEPLWTYREVVVATRGRLKGPVDINQPLTGVSIDTRTLKPGEIFAAIKGEVHDGHQFVPAAFQNGAGLAIVRDDYSDAGGAGAGEAGEAAVLLHVPDPLAALENLGRAARRRMQGRVIAVTGSVGKTGTKEALRAALSASGRVHASEKSYNNHWGVPLTLARLPRDADFGVFEVGMNHPGEITPLAQMIRPEIGIITTVEPVHLGFFDSVEQIAQAKAELFAGMGPDSLAAVLNRDNPYFPLLAKTARGAGVPQIISFGLSEAADVRALEIELTMHGSNVSARLFGEPIEYRLGAPGQHLVMNSLAVIAAVKLAGADLTAALAALAEITPPEGRGARLELPVENGTILLIDESYNANPASMRAALIGLKTIPRRRHPRRIAVLGDMLELGQRSAALHRELLTPVLEGGVDKVFACGPLMRELYDTLPENCRGAYAEDSSGLEDAVISSIKAGDVVMVKGSLGSRMGAIVEAIKDNFAKKSV